MKAKKFDCVDMKHEIQQQLLNEMKGLKPKEQRRIAEERILADPILGPFFQRVRRVMFNTHSIKKKS